MGVLAWNCVHRTFWVNCTTRISKCIVFSIVFNRLFFPPPACKISHITTICRKIKFSIFDTHTHTENEFTYPSTSRASCQSLVPRFIRHRRNNHDKCCSNQIFSAMSLNAETFCSNRRSNQNASGNKIIYDTNAPCYKFETMYNYTTRASFKHQIGYHLQRH